MAHQYKKQGNVALIDGDGRKRSSLYKEIETDYGEYLYKNKHKLKYKN